jgi:SpoVK/Ycf46/Vps4 family AAA+-type ATPase
VGVNFIYLSPETFSSLNSPDIFTALLRQVEEIPIGQGAVEEENRKTVLIVEDADHLIVEREKGTLSGISTILNMSDGLLGTALNLHIIATTNQQSLNIDPAVKRPGRLCTQIQIDPLTQEHAKEVFKRLTGVMPDVLKSDKVYSAGLLDTSELSYSLTLSEVYKLAAAYSKEE